MMATFISEDLIYEAFSISSSLMRLKTATEESYDVPDKELNLFIQLALQNDGKTGNKKGHDPKNEEMGKLQALGKVICKLLEGINQKPGMTEDVQAVVC